MTDITARLSTALANRYKIERHLGEGGMANVYLAHDIKHDRKVAVKVLRPELAAVLGAERFVQEIKTTANLQHPHILPLFDSGEADSFLYYVMPFIDGETLRDKLNRETQLGIDEAVNITTAIADALDYAHRNNVIHRDIKPENILLHDGRPMVADFGIALAVSAAAGGRMTETGLSLGTPHYMSPEQATAEKDLTNRSDIYSLGCVLYEMLTGSPPHVGSTAQQIIMKIVTDEARPVTELRKSVPPHVAAATAKSLEKLAADRFESAAKLAEALTNTAFTVPTTATEPSDATIAAPRSRRPVAVAVVGVLVALVLVFLGGRATAPETQTPLTRFIVPAPEGVRGYSTCCGPTEALSPDGQWLVFVGRGGGDGRNPLYRRQLGQLTAEEIPGTDDGTIPFFSPDGRWLGFHSDGRLRKVPMTGGPPVPITEIVRAEGASWGDNDIVVFSDNNSLHTVPGGGGVPTPVPAPADMRFIHPSMLPGGEAALARIAGIGAEEARIVVVDLESGSIDTIGFGTYAVYASGYLVFSGADGTLLAQPFDPGARLPTGQAMAILDGLQLAGPGVGEFALSTRGGLAYQPGGVAAEIETLVIVRSDGRTAVALPESGNLEDPAFSPDGGRIAMRLAGATQDIRIYDRDQQTFGRFTFEGGRNEAPVWTKDGTRIAFSSNREGVRQLYWKPSDGSGTAERLLESDYVAIPSSWFPDDKTLAFQARREVWDIGFLTVGDSAPVWRMSTEFNDYHPQISPDGRWLAYTSNRSGNAEVYVEAARDESGLFQVSTEGGQSPRWNPAGDILYFVSDETLIQATVTTDPDFRVTDRTPLFDGITDLNGTSVNYDVHPNGEDFVIIGQQGIEGVTGLVWILNWPEIVREMETGRR